MPPLRKPELLHLFEEALRASSLSFLKLSGGGDHPATYQILGQNESFRLRVYIWNLTFGGRVSLPDEWRIQVTGLPEFDGHQRFIRETGGKTAILGWCADLGVYAAYDIGYHLDPLGGSPSIQIRQPALESARLNGLAHHFRGAEEVAFAVRPSYMGVYLANMEELHACGSSEEALRLLEQISADPDSVAEAEIEERAPAPRKYAVISARKALREADFRGRVLTAYSNSCAMCGVQLRLLDAAHILPAAHPDSTDETRNGIALCASHHRAFDRGLVTFDSGFHIHRNEEMERELVRSGLDGGIDDFRNSLFPMIEVPPNRSDRPAEGFIQQVNEMRGWRF
ncbi:HNH endonuclease [Nisaea sp.]|uniref:HNH endonuclease n=1 Tax=Nisaea sp. TaxID=2024842 RepID=UPI003B523C67